MANQITIDIYLKNGNEIEPTSVNSSSNVISGIPGDSNATSGKEVPKNINNQSSKQLATYVSSQTISVFTNNVKAGLSQNIGLITGKKELQQRINFTTGIVSGTSSLISNMAQGGAIVSALGGSGPVGWAIGAILSVASFGINLAFNAQNLQIQENLENRQIQQTYTRAGASFNRSRSGT